MSHGMSSVSTVMTKARSFCSRSSKDDTELSSPSPRLSVRPHAKKFGRVLKVSVKDSLGLKGRNSRRSTDTEGVAIVTVEVPLTEHDLRTEAASRAAMGKTGAEAIKTTMSVRVKFRSDGNLLIGWDEYSSLKPGSCDLTRFPTIQWRSKRVSTIMKEDLGTMRLHWPRRSPSHPLVARRTFLPPVAPHPSRGS